MKRTAVLLLAGMVVAWGAKAQTSANAQANAGASAQAGSGAGQAGVQAQSSNSASASRTTEPSSRPSEKGKRQSATSASVANGSAASANAGPAAIQLDSGTAVNAVLVKSLDARRCKPGEKIEARTVSDVKQDGHVVIRKGSRLWGHVTEAQARTKGNAESSLGLTFDSVVMRNGEQAPLHLGVQALAAAQSAASVGDDEGMMGGASPVGGGTGRAGGGLLGGAGGTVGAAGSLAGGAAGNAGRMAGGTVGTATHATGSAAGNAGGLDAGGRLMSSSSGVFGLQGLQLSSATTSATEGSVVTSSTRNVHLDSGTQMVLSATKR